MLALAVAGGSVDASAYLGLGHVFPANMTGNTVLLGVGLAGTDTSAAARSAVVLAGFALGVIAATIALSNRGRHRTAGALIVEVVALVGVLIAWQLTGAPTGGPRYALIAAAGAAMGWQSLCARAGSGRSISATYVTGTLSQALSRLAQRLTGRDATLEGLALPGAIWLLYAAGAVAGAFAEQAWRAPALAIAIAMASSAAVLMRSGGASRE